MNRTFTPGIYNDLKIFLECGFANMLKENEQVEANGVYFSADPEFVKNRSGSWHPQQFLNIRRTMMEMNEKVNNCLEFYGALRHTFKHSALEHREVFHEVAVLVQLQIENGKPLFVLMKDYDDSKWYNGN